ncbi:LysM peptidoglycan-binding domain-containing protein [Alisedimentitalea sp. MJ-SS2]|uniref:LysM peptidoglycan-binding domain-containing protein n=1 Tax=Aliisedimentitalea sp. MJ-SS2 TaxID=3049795 RepID=UPI00291148CF|nr:LysM peptidoglycan-binding domain-containing protein [Alisedimentitalea sp. MJ-SS2]MDU8929395.1 LysM peptidoglycan-binding domain-containing protein [Alisedimentitalea sp. MJ-SS2]
MLRILAITGGFLTITAGLLYFQPGSTPNDPLARAMVAPQPAPVTPQTATAIIPRAQVSRAGTVLDLIGTTPTPISAPVPRPVARPAVATLVPTAAPATDADSLQSITAGVLAELRATPAVANAAPPQPATGSGAEFRLMTTGVLASLNAATGAAPSRAAAPQKLENLIVQALRQGQSDAYIDALLNEAAATGQVKVPSALVTPEGRVDTVTLLATLVEKSRGQSGVDTATLAAAAEGGTAVRPAKRVLQDQVYVVRPGDSLAAISYRFYGETLQYRQIFAANQEKLTSPDKIRIGQRLKIPAL